jgi:hypothetical protein
LKLNFWCNLEVWAGGRLLKELSVPAAVHGSVYNDGWFASGADWSADESRIAYVAEVDATAGYLVITSNLRIQALLSGLCQRLWQGSTSGSGQG